MRKRKQVTLTFSNGRAWLGKDTVFFFDLPKDDEYSCPHGCGHPICVSTQDFLNLLKSSGASYKEICVKYERNSRTRYMVEAELLVPEDLTSEELAVVQRLVNFRREQFELGRESLFIEIEAMVGDVSCSQEYGMDGLIWFGPSFSHSSVERPPLSPEIETMGEEIVRMRDLHYEEMLKERGPLN
jgi:hypothetical protein